MMVFEDDGTEESELPPLNKRNKCGTTSWKPTQVPGNTSSNPLTTVDKVLLSFIFFIF